LLKVTIRNISYEKLQNLTPPLTFIIVETLKDEHIDKKYGQFYELISDSMDESKVVFIDTKDVSCV